MTALGTLPQPDPLRKSSIGKTGVLTLHGFGIKVRVQAGHLEIEDGVGLERRKMKFARVNHGLKRLVVIGSDGFVSLAAFRWLANQRVGFAMLERDGEPLIVTGPVRPSEARLRRAQALAHHSGAALPITREVIAQKLKGQEQVARYKLLDSATANTIAQFRNELPSADSIASIRLIESQAALAYWSAWRTLPINFPKSDMHRVPHHWRYFGTRISPLTGSPRLSVNPANAMLNYLYAILESEALLAVSALGLDPGLGVLHADLANRNSLVLDVLEPIRAQVDSALLDWLTKQTLRREWFFEEPNGNCRIRASFALQLSQTAISWKRAIAPIAEWVAQALWNSTTNQRSPGQNWPTRLTQRKRSEGRGKEFIIKTPTAIHPSKVCGNCGATTHGGRLCPACGRMVSREKLIALAVSGRVAAQSDNAQKKRSETQRRNEAVKRAWKTKSQPSWPNERTYEREIHPRLSSISISTLASAMQVSEPYASDVRSGRRRPHPRHWETLATLVRLPATGDHVRRHHRCYVPPSQSDLD